MRVYHLLCLAVILPLVAFGEKPDPESFDLDVKLKNP